MKLVLASGSARRRAMLDMVGIRYEVCLPDVDEKLTCVLPPEETVMTLALRKARGVARTKDTIVVGSDTVVSIDNEILGKPHTPENARRMLRELSGRTHTVYSGIAVVSDWRESVTYEATRVTFRNLDDDEIDEYIATGAPLDKAGAYGIQELGGMFVSGIEGDINTVIGLPLSKLYEILRSEFGYDMLEEASRRSIARETVARLEKLYPADVCSLEYHGEAWKLLVMGRLSAQCTDARVNEVCSLLFEKYPSAAALAAADTADIAEVIRPCGLFNTKAKDIKNECALLVGKYGGRLPDNMDELLTFPGVGRKIANLLLGDIFKKSAIVADTHCMRVSARLGLLPGKVKKGNPEITERELSEIVEPESSCALCHRFVLFGREFCTARSPRCCECPLRTICRSHIRGEFK